MLLYFFPDAEAEQAQVDLKALEAGRIELDKVHVKILGVSPSKMPQLVSLQSALGLEFPLLRDDRKFSEAYGSVAPSEDASAPAALFLVDRRRKIIWMANPATDVAAGVSQALQAAKGLASQTENVPRSVVNRLLDRWLN